MASITKPILLAVVGILAVVLFLQTSSLITGFTIGQNMSATTNVSTNNAEPTVFDVNFSMVVTPTGCANDSATVWCWGTVNDLNGVVNISSVNATLWANALGESSCDWGATEENASKCYFNTSCNSNASLSGNATAAIYNCSFKSLPYYAWNGTWNCTMWATDGINSSKDNSADATLTTRDRSEYYAINIDTDIYWGAATVGEKKQDTDVVENCGNRPLDVQVNGTDMECDSGTKIGSTNITASVGSAAKNIDLSGTLQTLQTNHSVAVDACGATGCANETTFWNITIPSGATGTCKGNATFVAIEDS
ncbi:MAG: hypothetical protein PHC66_00230 [Candidatus Nanoarchaeia archaeon]|nr:hypothetical protein [Candidatus Nanoarchaeia archaeon]MDD5239624.1 hypothetical protein [Candidatus Nanoarchaeia archaeon]